MPQISSGSPQLDLQTFVDSLPYIAAVLDERGKIAAVNELWQQFARENGLEPDECGPRVDYLAVTASAAESGCDKASSALRGIAEVLDGTRREFSMEYSCHAPEKKRWFKLKAKPLADGVLIIHEKITGLKKEQRWTDSLFENTTMAAVMLDKNHEIINVNKPFENKFGYQSEEIIGGDLDEVLARGKEGSVDPMITEKIFSGQQVQKQGKRYDRDDNARQYLITGIPVLIEGKVEGVYEFYEDITDELKHRKKLEMMQFSMDRSSVMILRGKPDGEILYANRTAHQKLGYEEGELEGRNIEEFIAREQFVPHEDFWQKLKNSGHLRLKRNFVDNSGEVFPCEALVHYFRYDDEEYRFTFIRDITEREEVQEELQERMKELRCLFETSRLLVEVHKPLKEILREAVDIIPRGLKYPDNTTAEITYESRRYAGENFSKDQCRDVLSSDIVVSGDVAGELRLCYHGPEPGPGESLFIASEEKLIDSLADIIASIIKQKRSQERLEYMSFHDQLTGLYNHHYFKEKMKMHNSSPGLTASIIMVDIDGLSLINRSLGYEQGDEVLQSVADILKREVRERDTLARWGEDEFAILLPETSLEEVKEKRQHIVTSSDNLQINDKVSLSLSTGVAANRNEEDLQQTLNRASENMQKDKLTSNASSRSRMIDSLLNALGAKSHETEKHAGRLENLARELGGKIGLDNSRLSELSILAKLHDIGKVTIAEEILTKPGDLSSSEWEKMKKHPVIGSNIAAATSEFAPVADAIKHHHEWWDGSGYPDGLQGEEIPLLSRIIALVDAYDVMSQGRPYKDPMSDEEIIAEIVSSAGSQFDPRLAEMFVEILREKSSKN